MTPIKEEFISKDQKDYSFKIGKTMASALTGFIVGFLIATIVLIPYLVWIGKLAEIVR